MIARREAAASATVAFALLLAGCVGDVLSREATEAETRRGDAVVAVLDSGFNPYHDLVRVDEERDRELEALARELGAVTLPLTHSTDFDASVAADDGVWATAERATLYRFEGTALFGVSFRRESFRDLSPEPEAEPYAFSLGSEHSTAAFGRILESSERNVVLFVNTRVLSWSDEPGPTPDRVVTSESLLDALDWIGRQPWVDVVSLSAGIPGNPPDGGPLTPDLERLAAITRDLVGNGKMLVFAAGNALTPPAASGMSGPPWIVSVGGSMGRGEGDSAYAGKAPDFVANYTMIGPAPGSVNGTQQMRGTSFATPRVAGLVAAAIAELRSDAGLRIRPQDGPLIPAGAFGPHSPAIGPWEIRSALNATAAHWVGGAAQPDPAESPVDSAANASLPVAPVLPAAQMGWGYVDADEGAAALQRLREFARTGDRAALAAAPEKGPSADFMRAHFTAREAYWALKDST